MFLSPRTKLIASWGIHSLPFKLLSPIWTCQFFISSFSSLFSLAEPALLKDQSGLSALDDAEKKSGDAPTAVAGTLMPLPVPNKPESVVSITSQCSYSSTIVHVGDKKPQPESGTVVWKIQTSSLNLSIVSYFLYWNSETGGKLNEGAL